jgi:hypothetical protein
MIEQLAENLWRHEDSIPGMPLKRVMTIARVSDGGLVIHNGITLNDHAQLELLGPPRYLVVPNGWHRLDAAAYKAKYPGIKVLAPAGGRKKVEQKVPVDLTFDEFPADDVVKFEMLDGVKGQEGVMHVRSADGLTLVFTDAIFNLPGRFPGLWGVVYHEIMGSKPGPRVTRVAKLMLVKDKKAYRAHLERLAALPDIKRVIVAHGAVGDRETIVAAMKTL